MRLIDADELMLRFENINRVIGKSALMDIIAKAETVEEQEEKKPAGMFFICGRRACERCSPECNLTTDITHAENWSRYADGDWVEKEE